MPVCGVIMKKGIMYSGDLNQEEPVDENWVSKSQIKRECKEIAKFAQKLSQLTRKQLDLLDIPDELREEIDKASAIKSPVAKSRQVKYTGAVIRESGHYETLLQRFKKVFR